MDYVSAENPAKRRKVQHSQGAVLCISASQSQCSKPSLGSSYQAVRLQSGVFARVPMLLVGNEHERNAGQQCRDNAQLFIRVCWRKWMKDHVDFPDRMTNCPAVFPCVGGCYRQMCALLRVLGAPPTLVMKSSVSAGPFTQSSRYHTTTDADSTSLNYRHPSS